MFTFPLLPDDRQKTSSNFKNSRIALNYFLSFCALILVISFGRFILPLVLFSHWIASIWFLRQTQHKNEIIIKWCEILVRQVFIKAISVFITLFYPDEGGHVHLDSFLLIWTRDFLCWKVFFALTAHRLHSDFFIVEIYLSSTL